MAQGKEHVRRKLYRREDKTTATFEEASRDIKNLLKKGVFRRPVDITSKLKFKPKELTHLLPYLAQQDEILSMRTDEDTLLYYKRQVHIWFTTLYPAPKVNSKYIKSITRHHAR